MSAQPDAMEMFTAFKRALENRGKTWDPPPGPEVGAVTDRHGDLWLIESGMCYPNGTGDGIAWHELLAERGPLTDYTRHLKNDLRDAIEKPTPPPD